MHSNKKLKILYLINNLTIGGAETLLLATIKQLNPNHFDVYVCTLLKNGNLLYKDFEQHSKIYSLNMRSFHDIIGLYRLVKYIKYNNFDIVHTHLCYADTYGQLASCFFTKPIYISTFHLCDLWKEGKTLKHYLRIKFENILIRRFKKIIAVSNPVRDFAIKYQKFPNDKIITILNGVVVDAFRRNDIQVNYIHKELNLSSDTVLYGTIARLDQQKGHAFLIHAYDKIKHEVPNLKLIFIGDGIERQEIQALINKLNLSDNIYILGFRQDIKEILSSIDVFILPSVNEGLPISLLEAMSNSLPVIVTDVGGISTVVRNNIDGYIIPPQNINILSEKMKILYSNIDLRIKMGNNSFERIKEDFSLDKYLRQLEELYINLYNKKHQ